VRRRQRIRRELSKLPELPTRRQLRRAVRAATSRSVATKLAGAMAIAVALGCAVAVGVWARDSSPRVTP
jgi:ferric-dicitrate binding protein FerR (iron transport regulator)